MKKLSLALILSSAVLTTAAAAGTRPATQSSTQPSTQPGALEVGDPAPSFRLKSIDGEVHSLATSPSAAGPTILVFFRGAW